MYKFYVPDDEECESFVEFKERFLAQTKPAFPVGLHPNWNSLFYKYHYRGGNLFKKE